MVAERLRGVIPVPVEPWRGRIVSGLAVLGVGVLDRISHGAFSPLYTVPVVLAACEGNELLGPEGCGTNGLSNFDRIHFWRTPVAACASQGGQCVPYYRWVTDYIAVLGGR